jgi:glyoxylase-like metal-dependent hydrolase (beta-lactamase superfamily II)
MKQKGLLVFFLCISFLWTAPAFSTQQSQTPLIELDKLSDRLYQILGGRGANGGFYVGDNGVLIIDAKMTNESVEQTIEAIKTITDKPIKYLVNTHSDGDHITGNQFFPKSVTFVAHEKCREEFFHPRRDGKPSVWTKNPELIPFVPSVTYSEKMGLYLGTKKIELWYFGVGHTKGDTVVYFPEEKTAFLGDQIFMGRPQLIHSYKGGNSFKHVKTLTKMLVTLDAERFCSGHAEPIDRTAVKQHVEEVKLLQEKVKSLAEKGTSLEDIQKEFPENYSRLVASIYNEIKN